MIAEEVIRKFEALRRFAPVHSEMVDKNQLSGVAKFLFETASNPLPHLKYPEEAEKLIWEIVSLLRVSCVSEFAMDYFWSSNSPLPRNASSPRSFTFPLSSLLSRLSGTQMPVLTRALIGILYFMVPSFSLAKSVTMLPIITREHIVGYLLLFDRQNRNAASFRNENNQSIDLYKDTVLETVATRSLNRAVHEKSFMRKKEPMVFLLSGRNFALYPSAIEFSHQRGLRIRTADDMYALRESVKDFLKHHKQPIATDCKTSSRPLSASLASFLHELGDQISRIQEQMFFNEFREAVAHNRSHSLAYSIVPNLHLCWYPAAVFLFEEENGEMRLQRGNVFRPITGLPGEVVLSYLTSEECAKYQKVLINRALMFDSNTDSTSLLVQTIEEQISGPIWPFDNPRPHTRLILPLSARENDPSTKSGWIELWFLESRDRVEAMAELIADFISRAHVVGRKFIEDFEQEMDSERLRLIAEASHSVNNWFYSIIAKITSFGGTPEEIVLKKQILNQIQNIHQLFMGTVYLARERGAKSFKGNIVERDKYREFFPKETSVDLRAFLEKIVEDIKDMLSLRDDLSRRILDSSASRDDFRKWLSKGICLVIDEQSLKVTTIRNIVNASLLEALVNALESCDTTLEQPVKISVVIDNYAVAIRVSTRVPHKIVERLRKYAQRGNLAYDPGLGLFAMKTYQSILEKQLGVKLSYSPLMLSRAEECIIITEFGIGKIELPEVV